MNFAFDRALNKFSATLAPAWKWRVGGVSKPGAACAQGEETVTAVEQIEEEGYFSLLQHAVKDDEKKLIQTGRSA